MELSIETKKIVIELIKTKLTEAKALVSMYEKDLMQLEKDVKPSIILSSSTYSSADKNVIGTFKNIIISIFNDGVPKTSRDILIAYNKQTGRSLDMGGLSAQLSPLAKKGIDIKKLEIPEFPFDRRNFYGLSSWFDGDVMKSEFRDKIKTHN